MALSANQLMTVKLRPKLSLLGQLLQSAKQSYIMLHKSTSVQG